MRLTVIRWHGALVRTCLALAIAVQALAATAASSDRAAPVSAMAPPAGWTDFVATFNRESKADHTVGARVVFIDDGRLVAQHDYGYADRNGGEPVDANTIFHWASITKTMTAIAIMQLRDRGKLALDDPLTRYLPELRKIHNPYGSIDAITIRMALSHSAGFQDPTWTYGEGRSWEPFAPMHWSQLVAMMPYQEIHFSPGSRFSYSNPAFIYLGRIVTLLTGDPWQSYIRKNILAPLDMTRSYFGVTPYYLAPHRSHSYYIKQDSDTRRIVTVDNGKDFDSGIEVANGGWNSPMGDMLRYVGFLTDAANGDAVLQKRYDTVLPHGDLEEMWQPVQSTGSTSMSVPTAMGMSFFVNGEAPHKVVGHTGGQAGFTSFLFFNPSSKRAVAAAFNTANLVKQDGHTSHFRNILHAAIELVQ